MSRVPSNAGDAAAPGAAGDHQAFPRRDRQLGRQLQRRPGRGACAAGRERCRQEHAGQDHLRRAACRRGRDPLGWQAGPGGRPARRPGAGRRHGVPALLAVRGDDRLGERGAGRRRRHRHEGAGGPGARGQPRLRPAARTRARGAHALGRRAAADRDRALPAAEPASADHGRADLGADAAGGRQAVRDPAQARGRGRFDPLHQPQAARDQSALRRGHDPARRQGRGHVRSQGRDGARHGAADDRRRAAHADEARRAGAGPGPPGGRASRPGRRRRRTGSTSSGSASRSGPARSWASPESPATARTS